MSILLLLLLVARTTPTVGSLVFAHRRVYSFQEFKTLVMVMVAGEREREVTWLL